MLELATTAATLPTQQSQSDLHGFEAQFVVTQHAAPSATSVRTAKLLLVLLLGSLFVAVPASVHASGGQHSGSAATSGAQH